MKYVCVKTPDEKIHQVRNETEMQNLIDEHCDEESPVKDIMRSFESIQKSGFPHWFFEIDGFCFNV